MEWPAESRYRALRVFRVVEADDADPKVLTIDTLRHAPPFRAQDWRSLDNYRRRIEDIHLKVRHRLSHRVDGKLDCMSLTAPECAWHPNECRVDPVIGCLPLTRALPLLVLRVLKEYHYTLVHTLVVDEHTLPIHEVVEGRHARRAVDPKGIVLLDGMRLRCRDGQSVVLSFEASPRLVVVLPDMCYVLRALEDGCEDVIAVPTPPDALRVPVLSAHYEDDACFVVTSNDGRQWPACKTTLVVDLARVASSLNDVP